MSYLVLIFGVILTVTISGRGWHSRPFIGGLDLALASTGLQKNKKMARRLRGEKIKIAVIFLNKPDSDTYSQGMSVTRPTQTLE